MKRHQLNQRLISNNISLCHSSPATDSQIYRFLWICSVPLTPTNCYHLQRYVCCLNTASTQTNASPSLSSSFGEENMMTWQNCQEKQNATTHIPHTRLQGPRNRNSWHCHPSQEITLPPQGKIEMMSSEHEERNVLNCLPQSANFFISNIWYVATQLPVKAEKFDFDMDFPFKCRKDLSCNYSAMLFAAGFEHWFNRYK